MKRFIMVLCGIFMATFLIQNSYEIVGVRGAANVTVTVTNDGSFDNTYEIFDNVCQRALPDIPVAAHGKASLTLCSSGAHTGPECCGSFKDRIKGNSTWNNHDLLNDGQSVSL